MGTAASFGAQWPWGMVAGSGVEQPAGSRALLHGAVGSLTCVVNPILHVIETALLQRNYFRGADAGEGKEMRKRGWPIEVESSFHGIFNRSWMENPTECHKRNQS